MANTLAQVKELAPDSLTVHSLALKRATRLNLFKDEFSEISFANSKEIMDLCERTAMELSMGPYYLYRQKNMAGNFENVGYAKVDKAGIYNILIMESSLLPPVVQALPQNLSLITAPGSNGWKMSNPLSTISAELMR